MRACAALLLRGPRAERFAPVEHARADFARSPLPQTLRHLKQSHQARAPGPTPRQLRGAAALSPRARPRGVAGLKRALFGARTLFHPARAPRAPARPRRARGTVSAPRRAARAAALCAVALRLGFSSSLSPRHSARFRAFASAARRARLLRCHATRRASECGLRGSRGVASPRDGLPTHQSLLTPPPPPAQDGTQPFDALEARATIDAQRWPVQISDATCARQNLFLSDSAFLLLTMVAASSGRFLSATAPLTLTCPGPFEQSVLVKLAPSPGFPRRHRTSTRRSLCPRGPFL